LQFEDPLDLIVPLIAFNIGRQSYYVKLHLTNRRVKLSLVLLIVIKGQEHERGASVEDIVIKPQ